MDWTNYSAVFFLCFLLAFLSSFLGKSSKRRSSSKLIEYVFLDLLPGFDCGLCEYVDCLAYAKSLARKGGDPGRCVPGGPFVERSLRERGGSEMAVSNMAVIHCGGNDESVGLLFKYEGALDCKAAFNLYSGPKACAEACIGLGSCVRVCPLNAIILLDGRAAIDAVRCTGCGLCVPICPVAVITLVPRDSPWHVACNSRRTASLKQETCKVACIACGECVRKSPSWQFTLDGTIARASTLSSESGIGLAAWAAIAETCPTHAIKRYPSEKSISASS